MRVVIFDYFLERRSDCQAAPVRAALIKDEKDQRVVFIVKALIARGVRTGSEWTAVQVSNVLER
jgi:hypothetical protein